MGVFKNYNARSWQSCYLLQVIGLLAYSMYLIDRYQKFWLRHIWGFDSELSFYYICGKIFSWKNYLLYLLCNWTNCLHKVMGLYSLRLPNSMVELYLADVWNRQGCCELKEAPQKSNLLILYAFDYFNYISDKFSTIIPVKLLGLVYLYRICE